MRCLESEGAPSTPIAKGDNVAVCCSDSDASLQVYFTRG